MSLEDDALARAADVTCSVTRLAREPYLIGLDFADLRAIFDPPPGTTGQIAVYGRGEAAGDGRALRAAEAALADIQAQIRALRGAA